MLRERKDIYRRGDSRRERRKPITRNFREEERNALRPE